MKNHTALLAIIAATVSACVQEDPALAPVAPATTTSPPVVQPPSLPPVTSEGKDFFVKSVYPSIEATCGSCHIEGRNGAPQWLGASASAAYDQLRAYKSGLLAGPIESNLLLLKESHAGGQQLNGQQKGLVQQWLKTEYGADGGGKPASTFSQSLENFANCMNFNDWDGRELDQLPLVPVSVDGVDVQNANCETCHLDADKAASLFLDSNDAQATFDGLQIFPSIMKLVTSRGFPFRELVASERLISKGKEYQNCVVNNELLAIIADGDLNNPDYCHPTYIVDQAVEDELELFVDNTIAITKNGNCANQGQ